MKPRKGALPIVLSRLAFPLAALVFAGAFYANVRNAGPAERLFPILLITAMAVAVAVVVLRELRTAVQLWRLDDARAVEALDAHGLREVAWTRPALVALAALIFYLAIDRVGLLATAFVVYLVVAAALIEERSSIASWVRAVVGAVVTAVVLDLAFRKWLGLPLPLGLLGF